MTGPGIIGLPVGAAGAALACAERGGTRHVGGVSVRDNVCILVCELVPMCDFGDSVKLLPEVLTRRQC